MFHNYSEWVIFADRAEFKFKYTPELLTALEISKELRYNKDVWAIHEITISQGHPTILGEVSIDGPDEEDLLDEKNHPVSFEFSISFAKGVVTITKNNNFLAREENTDLNNPQSYKDMANKVYEHLYNAKEELEKYYREQEKVVALYDNVEDYLKYEKESCD